MGQRIKHILTDEVLQITARFAEAVTPADGVTDTESLANEVVECGILRDDVPPVFAGSECDICLAFDCVDSFLFDER